MAFRGLLCALTAGLLAASCTMGPARTITVKETVEVRVPVPVRREPPAELAQPYRPEALPAFVSPGHPQATSALTPEGEMRLRILLNGLMARDAAWREWGMAP